MMNSQATATLSPERSRYAEVLEKCRNRVLTVSKAHLAEVFEHSYTALLEFAERADNNAIQGQFFDAIHLIEQQRSGIERLFCKEINNGFNKLGKLNPPTSGLGSKGKGTLRDGLSLMEHDELDESIAVESLTTKATTTYFVELEALSLRFSVVNGERELRDHEIPARPDHLVQSFRRAIEQLNVGVKVKLVLYALFDRFFIKQAKDLYDELNDYLKDAGILPNLSHIHMRFDQGWGSANAAGKHEDAHASRKKKLSDKATAGEVNEQTPTLGEDLFDAIIDLMSSRRARRKDSHRRSAVPTTPAQRAAAVATSHDLVAALHGAQTRTTPERVHTAVAHTAVISSLEVAATAIEQLKRTLTQEREQALSQIDRDNLSHLDSDLIDLIGMLFEYMLNDPLLPNIAKALLSHLHTPYLKVALIDRRLLVDARHSARRLLDQMVEAGSLWVDEKNPKQGIFPALQGVVERVLKEFSDDVTLFEKLLVSFEKSMKEQQRKADTIEQRTKDAALGRERLRLAKKRASQRIQTLLSRTPLPAPVISFLSNTWLDRLIFILLRDKDEDRGNAWQEGVRIAEDLVALFEPKAGALSLTANTEGIADLRARIAEGIRSMGSYPHSTSDTLFGLLDVPETWQESCAEAAATQPEQAGAEKIAEDLSAQEVGLTGRAVVSEQEQEIVRQLSKMKFGTWFELQPATGETPRRIKLSWLSPLTATCMFVDRSGMQVETKTMAQLAQDILSGRAKVIPRPKHHFIERALISIRKMLQTEGKGATAACPSA